ncbi:hypothetical protein [Chiayiivirga flava]|uniref:Uncharacterized protein n=1 Tax=Chiayiivirga flava TaxID=659595 RepID=A0A7W8D4M8_9GAMM|nr:hypothetical protein [Chiayiivirga flava]MBB5207839.1 hypothetical protein [Chiayiivirga flava]
MQAMTAGLEPRVASDAQLQRHDLMIELYRLDQASTLARRQARAEDLSRIERARARVSDVLARLPA